jgi:hypothetical protein
LAGKPERKRPLRTSRHRWEDNNTGGGSSSSSSSSSSSRRRRRRRRRMALGETERGSMDFIHQENTDQWRALVNMVMYLTGP